jgi:hypothetical protein
MPVSKGGVTMPQEENKAFIKDKSADMTTTERTLQLSSALAKAPNVNRNISRIERVTEGTPGWNIFYWV